MAQERLDQTNIGAGLQEMGRKALALRMQADGLLDPGRLGRLFEQAGDLACRQLQSLAAPGEQPTLMRRHFGIVQSKCRKDRHVMLPPESASALPLKAFAAAI